MKILIAEDEPTDRLLLEAAVRRLGHDCLITADGAAAWQQFETWQPDVVISDWHMPHVSGSELCRRIRAAERSSTAASRALRYTPFIFLSGNNDKTQVLAAMTVGADDYLAKPVDLDDLHARLIGARRLKDIEEERFILLERERAARLSAEQAITMRDEVLSSLSHDLRTPLTVIVGRANLLRRRLTSGTPATSDVTAEVVHIERAAKRMAGWLDQLTEAALLQIGRPMVLQPDATDLVALARELVSDQSISETHPISLESDVETLIGHWDRPRLERVLVNLIGNSVKYSPTTSQIRVCLTTAETLVGSWAVVRVIDAGIGIPAADLPHVFDRFYRASNVDRRAVGQGIGLAGVRQIVEQHGGSITLESSVGHGTTGIVRLPIDHRCALSA